MEHIVIHPRIDIRAGLPDDLKVIETDAGHNKWDKEKSHPPRPVRTDLTLGSCFW